MWIVKLERKYVHLFITNHNKIEIGRFFHARNWNCANFPKHFSFYFPRKRVNTFICNVCSSSKYVDSYQSKTCFTWTFSISFSKKATKKTCRIRHRVQNCQQKLNNDHHQKTVYNAILWESNFNAKVNI